MLIIINGHQAGMPVFIYYLVFFIAILHDFCPDFAIQNQLDEIIDSSLMQQLDRRFSVAAEFFE